MPEGGTTGQVLAKKSDADGDVEWINQSGGSDVSSEIESLSAAASELASENAVQTSEIGSLASELDSMSVSDISSELESLSNQASEHTSEIASLASEMESMSVSDISSELASLSTEASEHESEINSLSIENSTQTSELAAHSQSLSEIASAASSTSTAQSQYDSTQDSHLASLSEENSTQTSELASLSTAESEMASEMETMDSELDKKQPMLTEGPGIDIDEATNEIKTEVNLFTGKIAEWEALTLVQKKQYTHAAITDDEYTGNVDQAPTEDSPNLVTSGGVYKNSSFSTSEIETSIEFNGRKVYRRTFRGYADTYVTYSALRQFNVGLIDSGVEEVINAYGMIEYGQNNYEYQIPSIAFKANGDLANTCHIRHHKTGHSISLMSESLEAENIQRIDYIVTVEYTKTN